MYLDYDGNLMDAAVLGSIAALMNTKIPEARIEGDEVILDHDNMIPLPINEKALMCTFAKIGGELLVDPSLEEEEIMGARIINWYEQKMAVYAPCRRVEQNH